jgi:putative isomerase
LCTGFSIRVFAQLKSKQASLGRPLELRQFANVLNSEGTPNAPNETTNSVFFDCGAWHGFGLPNRTDRLHQGGFTGPFVPIDSGMHGGAWSSKSLLHLHLREAGTQRDIDLSEDAHQELSRYPGWLEEVYHTANVLVKLRLWFISDRSSLIQAVISNVSGKELRLDGGWDGELLLAGAKLKEDGKDLRITFPRSAISAEITFSSDPSASGNVSATETEYTSLSFKSFTLKPGKSISLAAVVSVYTEDRERERERAKIRIALANPEASFSATRYRWHLYLRPLFERIQNIEDRPVREIAVVKAVETLVGNWRSPAGDLDYSGLFPSWASFQGFWAWDSWKQASALVLFAPNLAKDQVRAMFALQNANGMIPDVIYRDKRNNNFKNSKPPLAAWAVWRIFAVTRDRGFLEEMYPKLVSYHRWWYKFRDHDGEGLCEYGAEVSFPMAAKWESGMDNAARFDSAELLANREGAWVFDQQSVDLNSYLYAEKRHLARIAAATGRKLDAEQWNKEADAVKKKIAQKMFDSETGYFYDNRLLTGELVKTQGPEGWIPLWAGVASPEQAADVLRIILNPAKFGTPLPLPSLSADDPRFAPERGYWRGPVWLDQAYFAVVGMRSYGFKKEADALERTLLMRTRSGDYGISLRENYDPLTANGQNALDFGWSAASVLMLAVRDESVPRQNYVRK